MEMSAAVCVYITIAESDARRIELDPTNPNRIWWSGDTSSHLGYIEVIDK
jgi:hypothetical protein